MTSDVPIEYKHLAFQVHYLATKRGVKRMTCTAHACKACDTPYRARRGFDCKCFIETEMRLDGSILARYMYIKLISIFIICVAIPGS